MMGGSTGLTIVMVVMMVAMMGGVLYGAGWAFIRRRRDPRK
jgi:ABC-type dipeptide/oligopeptide/nickel transport system permease subunit